MAYNAVFVAETAGKGAEGTGRVSAKTIQRFGECSGFSGSGTGNLGDYDFVLAGRREYSEFSAERFVCWDTVVGGICKRSHHILDIAVWLVRVIRIDQ
jgi:hypothetical protein